MSSFCANEMRFLLPIAQAEVKWEQLLSENLRTNAMGKLENLQLTLRKTFLITASDGVSYDSDSDNGLAVQEERPKLKRPPLYKVIMLNDDYTPMEFVVETLEQFFGMDREKATRVMLTVHTQGRATCGLYSRDVAETKAAQVNQHARDNEHPLLCEIEAAEDDDH